ncbi:MAG TPA: pitrilysin family protein [Candidatus Acidoferrales bacterium]|nr:pitrilysin family protein [Candidatus Acidoferrales bacterium]
MKLSSTWRLRSCDAIRRLLGLACLGGLIFTVVPRAAGQATSAAPAVRPPELPVASRQLPNGLRVLMVEDHAAPVINLQMWYHVGSKDEKPGRTGFAHLFEHLMFKGSAHVGPEQHSRIIEAVGGFDNAYTNDDVTVYFETFPSNYLERVIWLEADRMGSLNVDEANFHSEREVVKEERRVRLEDRPYGQVIEDLYAAAFTVHPYKHTTIGSMEDLNKATVEDVRRFFRTYYRPDNATLVMVGDLVPSEAFRWVEKYFGGVPRPAQRVPRLALKEPPQQAERRLTKSYSNSPLPAVIEGYQMPALFTPDSYPLSLASNILSAGESSRLYRKLVYEDRVAVEAAGFGNFTEDPNLFCAFAIMNEGKTSADGEKTIDAVLGQMKAQPVDPKELEKAQNQEIASFILGRQTMQGKADALGRYAALGKDAGLINTELGRYLRVTAADIERVAREYFVPQHRTVLVVEPRRVKQ